MSTEMTGSSVALVRLEPYTPEKATGAHCLLRPFARGAAKATGGGLFTVLRNGGQLSLRAGISNADLQRIDHALTAFGYGLEY
jgi:hypothetical protein